jgi:hypothetical protein
MKTEHTHRGTCQACGARQAVDNSTSLVAKHGYKVAGFGYFAGVCYGADHNPAELDVTLTHRTIANLTDYAAERDRLSALYASRDLMVYRHDVSVWVKDGKVGRYGQRSGMYVTRTYPLFGATDSMIEREYNREAEGQASAAERARSHIEFLRKDVLPRLGQPLFAVADEVATVKPADGKVNVRTGHVEGTFRTKAAKKTALEAVGREYEKARRVIMDKILEVSYEDRTPAMRELYDVLPFDLHNYRAKQGAAVIVVYPQMADTVAEMGRLFDLRTSIKAIEVTK